MNKSFGKWIFSFKKPFNTGIAMILAVSSLLVALFTIINKVDSLKINWETEKLIEVNIVAHIVLLLVLILFPGLKKFTRLSKEDAKREKIFHTLELEKDSNAGVLTSERKISEVVDVYKRANFAIGQFLTCFKRALYSYLVLYIIMAVQRFYGDSADIPLWVYDFLQILANNMATLFLIFCFTIISIPSKNPLKTHIQNRDVFIVILVAVTLVDFFIRIPDGNLGINKAFYMLSGIVSSIAIAQIAGRLDSKLIDSSYWVYVMLYLYAGIQPFFTFFISDQTEGTNLAIMLYLALFLKTIFFLFVYWCINFNKLFYYLVRVNRIKGIVDKDWKTIQKLINDEEGEALMH